MTEVLYDEIREFTKENSKLKAERKGLVAELQDQRDKYQKISLVINNVTAKEAEFLLLCLRNYRNRNAE